MISLEQFGLQDDFTVLETGSPEGPDKVNGIRNVLVRLNANVEDSIYVGDAPSDITACREAGIRIAAAAWAATANPDALKPLNPDWIFYSVQEFEEWLNNNI